MKEPQAVECHTRDLEPGRYSHHNEDGGLPVREWYAMTPNGILTHLGGYEVTEHEDGTITIFEPERVDGQRENGFRAPGLIQATMETKSWRGYLEKGVWREAS